jgi:hypothetical protein
VTVTVAVTVTVTENLLGELLLNILGHDGDHLGVDSAEIDVLEQGAGSMREVLDQVFVEHHHSSPNLKHPVG